MKTTIIPFEFLLKLIVITFFYITPALCTETISYDYNKTLLNLYNITRALTLENSTINEQNEFNAKKFNSIKFNYVTQDEIKKLLRCKTCNDQLVYKNNNIYWSSSIDFNDPETQSEFVLRFAHYIYETYSSDTINCNKWIDDNKKSYLIQLKFLKSKIQSDYFIQNTNRVIRCPSDENISAVNKEYNAYVYDPSNPSDGSNSYFIALFSDAMKLMKIKNDIELPEIYPSSFNYLKSLVCQGINYCPVSAVYHNGKIYYRQELDLNDIQTKSILVHEMIHHIQNKIGFKPVNCDIWRRNEKEAYKLQGMYLINNNEDDSSVREAVRIIKCPS